MKRSSLNSSFRSFAVLGGGQLISTLANALKMKFTAGILGPTGVGLVGIYTALVSTAASIASLGMASGSTRELANAFASGDAAAESRARRAIFWLTLLLAFGGATLFLALSRPIARLVLDSQIHAGDIAWLSIGVALTVGFMSQAAVLAGLHRVGDQARVNAGAGLVGAILGAIAVWLLRDRAPVVMVLATPAVTVLAGAIVIARLDRPRGSSRRLAEVAEDIGPILRISVYALYVAVIFQAGFLATRALVQHRLGFDSSGQFQAAWAIGMAFQGAILASITGDFFPRITAAAADRISSAKMINEQIELGLLICLPFALVLMGLAPWVIRLLYTPQFLPAVDLLRWQIVGDLLKMACFPMGYALVAFGATRAFAVNQTISVAIYIAVGVVGIPTFGLAAVGFAYVAMWVVYLPIPWWTIRQQIDLRWSRGVRFQSLLSLCCTGAVGLVLMYSNPLGAVLGCTLALITGLWALIRIAGLVGDGNGRLSKLARIGKRLSRRSQTRN